MLQPNFAISRPQYWVRSVLRKRDIHKHPRFAFREHNQPIYDFAIIRVNKPMFYGRQISNNKVIPICLPKRWMWNMKFVGQIAKVSGYGRVESVPVEGESFLKSTRLNKFRPLTHQLIII